MGPRRKSGTTFSSSPVLRKLAGEVVSWASSKWVASGRGIMPRLHLDRTIFGGLAAAALLAGCTGSQSAPAMPHYGAQASSQGNAVSTPFYWNKTKVVLHYPGPRPKHRHPNVATLIYDHAQYNTQLSCPGEISAQPWHDDGWEASYVFTAETPGPVNCTFTATKNGSGSQTAVLDLHIARH